MKRFLNVATLLVLVVSIACSTTQDRTSSSNNNSSSTVLAKNLPRYVDQLPRISVQGSGNNVNAINTSASTFSGSTSPLFILDNIQIGRSFSDVMNLLSSDQAVSVKYLTTRRATVLYGESGKNGAIILKRVQGG